MHELSKNPQVAARAIEAALNQFPKKVEDIKKADLDKLKAAFEKARRAAARAPVDEMFMPQDKLMALIQAEMDRRMQQPDIGLEALGSDILFSNVDPGWASVLAALIRKALTPDAEFISHTSVEDFRFTMPSKTRVAIFSDWGTGRPAAEAVAAEIAKLDPEFLIHLGDIYYAGQEDEVRNRFLDKLPRPASLRRRFALNANHEMYSGGHGYFKIVLPEFEQPASYFSLANENWQLIGLDSGYKDKRLKDPQFDWLKAQLDGGNRRNILMTHHQLFSCFEDVDERLIKRVGKLLDAGKIHGWFWGHEHKHIVYKKHRGCASRCVGHGAIPYLPPSTDVTHKEFKTDFVNRRMREDSVQCVNGFAILDFDGPKLHVQYVDEDGRVSFQEDLGAAIGGLETLTRRTPRKSRRAIA